MSIFKKTKPAPTLESEHEQLKINAAELGKQNGKRSLVKQADSITVYVEPIRAWYQSLLSKYCKPILNDPKLADLENEAFTKEQIGLEKKLEDLKRKLDRLTVTKDALGTDVPAKKSYMWAYCLIVAIGVFESFFTYRSFSFEGNSQLVQSAIFLVLVIVFIGIPVVLRNFYQLTKESPYRLLYWGLTALVFIGGFYVLAVMRSKFLGNAGLLSVEATGGESISMSPIALVTVQAMLLFLSTFAATLIPTPEERNETASIQKLHNDITNTEQAIADVEDQLASMPGRRVRTERMKIESAALNANTEARIRSMYAECVGVFKESYSTWHTERPACFDQPIPEL